MNSLVRANRRPIAELIYIALASVALAASFLLRFEFSLAAPYGRMLAVSLPLLLAAKLAVFRAFGLRDLAWRYLGFRDLLRLASGNLAASAASSLLLYRTFGNSFPRSIYIIDLLAATTLTTAAHAAAKAFWERRPSNVATPRKRVAIYGAGTAGAALAAEISSNPQSGLHAAAFFDDDPLKRNLRIRGVRVLGGLENLPTAVRKRRIEMVLVAIPSATGTQLTATLEKCRAAGVAAKRVPALAAWPSSRPLELPSPLAPQIRDLQIEDLLGRRPVDLDAAEIRARLAGRAVLVTGAGGSIGSELCRQIALHQPSALIGFDHSETVLYQIDRELRARYPQLAFYPEIGSIRDRRRLEDLFREYAPQSVYHAAAYKHVPLMESQLFEAVENNVFGTRNVARAAADFGACDFVLISSDKAVRPANVMGATKRLAEMVIQSMTGSSRTRFTAVRFGNVLGSSGSVIPLFREQIAAGGPVTVTHPEMQRFFMTVGEAAQLVLEAAAMEHTTETKGGRIFVLDMGEPVRILDLARKMILLSGLRPGEDIRIEFTGIRPGEKLYEELNLGEETTLATPHSQIRLFSARPVSASEVARGIEKLQSALDNHDTALIVKCLEELVPGYRPSEFLLRRSVEEQNAFA